MEREQLERARFGDERPWVDAAGGGGGRTGWGGLLDGGRRRRREERCKRKQEGAARGRWVQGWTTMGLRWRCRAATCMRGATSRRWRASAQEALLNGAGAVGARSVRA